MPNIEASDTFLLCKGGSCAKKQQAAFKRLVDAATRCGLEPIPIKCLGSCEGPTAVLHIAGDYRLFERLNSGAAQDDLVALATGTANGLTKRLTKRELKGKQRAKAAKKLRVS